jgi:predicted Zn-dependent protease
MTPELSPLKRQLFLLIVFVFFVTVQSIVAQPVLYFPSEEIVENKYFREKVVESQKKEKARISGFTKKQVNLINEQIDYRIDLLLSLMTSGEILFDSPLQKYVEAVFYKLLKANPVIDQSYQVIVSRSSVPNAFNVGGGFIIINTGLIERLQSEEELAFILAHELSHQVMDHVNQNIAENVIAETDKVRKEQIKKNIAKQVPCLFAIRKSDTSGIDQ